MCLGFGKVARPCRALGSAPVCSAQEHDHTLASWFSRFNWKLVLLTLFPLCGVFGVRVRLVHFSAAVQPEFPLVGRGCSCLLGGTGGGQDSVFLFTFVSHFCRVQPAPPMPTAPQRFCGCRSSRPFRNEFASSVTGERHQDVTCGVSLAAETRAIQAATNQCCPSAG